jgi:hypothetical protein
VTEPGTDLTIPDERGELVPLKDAPTERIAAFIDQAADRRAQLAEWETLANSELLDRLDRDCVWTQRIGEFELKAPSPTAGTDSYDTDLLEGELYDLLHEQRISKEAASGALRRQLTLCLEVGWGVHPAELAQLVERAVSIEVGGHAVKVLSASGSLVPVVAGIGRLRKLGLGDKLDTARVETPPPRRRVKVTRKGRA